MILKISGFTFYIIWVFCSLRSCQFCPFKLITQFYIDHQKKKLVIKKKFDQFFSHSSIPPSICLCFFSPCQTWLYTYSTVLHSKPVQLYPRQCVRTQSVCLNFRNVYCFNLVILIGYLKRYFIPQQFYKMMGCGSSSRAIMALHMERKQ